jgi:hypothetical protein
VQVGFDARELRDGQQLQIVKAFGLGVTLFDGIEFALL